MKKIVNREAVEWTNTWLSGANIECERVLLIGDSVTRDLRKALADEIKKRALDIEVDLFASTFAIMDNLFWQHVKGFFSKEYKYKYVIINYGFHHSFFIQCNNNENDKLKFKNGYIKLIELCRQFCENVLLMTGTLMVFKNSLAGGGGEEKQLDAEILSRNMIVKEVAKEIKCEVFDLYGLMEKNIEMKKYVDHVHFEEKTYNFICQWLLDGLV